MDYILRCIGGYACYDSFSARWFTGPKRLAERFSLLHLPHGKREAEAREQLCVRDRLFLKEEV